MMSLKVTQKSDSSKRTNGLERGKQPAAHRSAEKQYKTTPEKFPKSTHRSTIYMRSG